MLYRPVGDSEPQCASGQGGTIDSFVRWYQTLQALRNIERALLGLKHVSSQRRHHICNESRRRGNGQDAWAASKRIATTAIFKSPFCIAVWSFVYFRDRHHKSHQMYIGLSLIMQNCARANRSKQNRWINTVIMLDGRRWHPSGDSESCKFQRG